MSKTLRQALGHHVSVAEAAKILGLTDHDIREMIDAGGVIGVWHSGVQHITRRAMWDIERWLKAQDEEHRCREDW